MANKSKKPKKPKKPKNQKKRGSPMVRRERFSNNAETTLGGAINDSVTSLTVTSAATFPTEGNFRLLINDELFLVTAVAGAVFTVVRGAEGTSAAAHADGDEVVHIVTEEGLTEHIREGADPWHQQRPPYRIVDSSGDKLTQTDFTQVNFTGMTAEDEASGAISIENTAQITTTAHNLRMLLRTAPSSPYTITACVDTGLGGYKTNSIARCHYGMVFRESSTSKLATLSFTMLTKYFVGRWTNETNFAANPFQESEAKGLFYRQWMKLEDDGTNVKFHMSHNGVNFVEIYSAARTDFFTTAPNQVGFYYSTHTCFAGNRVTLLAWDGE